MARARKTVVGTTKNRIFNVEIGKKCFVMKTYFYNGETWYKLNDCDTGELFASPTVFWE